MILQCAAIPGVQGFIDHVTNPNRNETEVIVIGTDCSISTQPIASLTPVFNLVQINNSHNILIYIGEVVVQQLPPI